MKRTGFAQRSTPMARGTSTLARAAKPMRAVSKTNSNKPGATAAEKRHMGRVADLGCVLCRHLGLGATPAEIHHPRLDVGAGQRSSHMEVIGLCPTHHRGKNGVHDIGHAEFTAFYGISERKLMAITKAELQPLVLP